MSQEHEISWTTQTHEHYERSNDWYWTLGVLSIVGTTLSVFFGNTLLAVIILISAVCVGVLASRGPREHQVKFDQRGMVIDGTRYPYSSLHSFWVEHDTDSPRLFVSMTGILSPHFSLYLPEDLNPEHMRNFLHRHVPQEEQGPRVGDHVAEIFGL